jgi:hypothetical protein
MMAEDPNEIAIQEAVQDGFAALDEESRTATIRFDPNDPKLEIKRALGIKAALEHRGYKVHAPELERMGFKFSGEQET